MNGDGSAALISGSACNRSSCYSVLIWWRGNGLNWTQAQTIFGIGGNVAISSDGSTALVNSPSSSGTGAVTVLNWNGVSWGQQQVLTDKNAASDQSYFGTSLALSANGSVAFIGGDPGGSNNYGAAFLFARTGTTWTQQQTLSAAGTGDGEYSTVALNGDGTVAMVAMLGPEDPYGTVSVFQCSASHCVRVQSFAVKSQPDGYGNGFGGSVSLSSAGTTALIGDGYSSDPTFAAWVFTS